MKDTVSSKSFFALEESERERLICELGGRPFHAKIIAREACERGVLDYAEMSSLSKKLREQLPERMPLLTGVEVASKETRDGTTKLLVRFPDKATVETVHMPSRRAGRGATLCVSTQVGCPVGCPFCASGKAGLVRNLEAHEIFEQFLRGRAIGELGRSVVMGIGEPLLNFEALRQAIELVRQHIGIGARKITVSTVGYPQRLKRIAREHPPFELAISLHSPDDQQRARLVPAMANVTVEEILLAGTKRARC